MYTEKNIVKYHPLARIIHWLMAVIVLSVAALGIYMTSLNQDAVNRLQVYNLHKSLGVIVLLLIFIRIINRLIFKPPHLPFSIRPIERQLAYIVHYALYLLMICVPLSGYLMSNSFGFPVHLFSIQMPVLVAADPDQGRFFAELHEVLAYSMLGLVALHTLGAFKHLIFDRDGNVLRRML